LKSATTFGTVSLCLWIRSLIDLFLHAKNYIQIGIKFLWMGRCMDGRMGRRTLRLALLDQIGEVDIKGLDRLG